ncbi:MAG: AI-2E family transporter [Prevotellaceae bacterium]|jgi:predicted PurR-regulated permease PerM|nr:AI-2E family transporter [Prevotellaceae bacterium]
MNRIVNYVIIGIIVAAVAFLTWYFSKIVAYLLISAVLALMCKPLIAVLKKATVRGRRLPSWTCASIGLITVWTAFYAFFALFIPLVFGQAQQLASVDLNEVVNSLTTPLNRFEGFINTTFRGAEFSFNDFFSGKISTALNSTLLSDSFGSITNLVVSLAVAVFSISFITFFFMKEESLFIDGMVILFPARYESGIRHAWSSATRLLARYFIGVIIDMLCVMTVLTVGHTFVAGLGLKTALIIGLIAGILNVIPYVGPLIAAGIGIVIGAAANVDMFDSGEIGGLVIRMLIVFATMKILDDIFFQPYIFANSVKAHPLEIFLLILLAGSLAGIGGMLLAIPAYTVLRVFAKEFFNRFRVVQKLTENL